jgi:hypothetical protein
VLWEARFQGKRNGYNTISEWFKGKRKRNSSASRGRRERNIRRPKKLKVSFLFKVLKNNKNSEIIEVTQLNEEVKLKIVNGPDHELDHLEIILKQSILRERQLYFIGIINNEGLSLAKNNYKDDLNSWNLSEDPNESTFDRLRTPTPKPYNIASNIGLGDELSRFENFSNKEWINEKLVLEEQQNLKDNYCSLLLKLTRQKQSAVVKVHEGIQTLNKTTNKLNTLNETLVIKPIFSVIRSKREQYKPQGKSEGSVESTQSSAYTNTDSQIFKVPELPYKDEAVMLIS